MAARTRAGGIAAAFLAAALIAGASPAAFADEPAATPSPSATPSDPAAAQILHDLAIRIVALQRTAEHAGETAQKAGEKSNDAEAASKTADQQLQDARDAAEAAQEKAVESRARASALAAQLARTNMGTLPLDLLLNGRSAEGVLGGLSTTGQLSVQSRLLFDTAHADQLEAERLQGVATKQAADAADKAKQAKKAYAAAKKEAASAKKAVTKALDEQRALLGGNDGTSAAGVCGDVGSAPVAACLPDTAPGPAGKSVGAKVVRFAQAQIGKPYVFAAAGPNAYDCSGLTLAAYASAGVSIGIHSATAQYNLAARQGDLVPLKDAKPGDLLFYTDGGGDMYHVTIYAGGGLMLEAPYPGSTVRQAPIRTGDLVSRVAHFG
jgi:cell wall-associated NlpC family hydrolase